MPTFEVRAEWEKATKEPEKQEPGKHYVIVGKSTGYQDLKHDLDTF